MDQLIVQWLEDADAEISYRFKNWQDFGYEIPPTLGKVREDVFADEDYWHMEWDDLFAELTAIIRAMNPEGFWHAQVLNFGWRALDGHKTFKAVDGKSLLSAILPEADCHFKVYRAGKCLKINNAHHDSPAWNEWYILKPLSCRQYAQRRGD